VEVLAGLGEGGGFVFGVVAGEGDVGEAGAEVVVKVAGDAEAFEFDGVFLSEAVDLAGFGEGACEEEPRL
jgi:hypothetical protein